MTPALIAAQEPHLWTRGPAARGKILVQHPNGVELNITRGDFSWFIRKYLFPANAHSNGQLVVAEIPRTSRMSGLDGLLHDAHRVIGSSARGQLDRLLHDIRCWLAYTQARPLIANLHRHQGTLFIPGQQDTIRLPLSLAARSIDLRPVMVVDSRQRKMIDVGIIQIELPATLHGILELRAQYTPE